MVICCAIYEKRTANTDHQTRNSKEDLAVSELIQYLRLPPRAPYEKDFRKEVLFLLYIIEIQNQGAAGRSLGIFYSPTSESRP